MKKLYLLLALLFASPTAQATTWFTTPKDFITTQATYYWRVISHNPKTTLGIAIGVIVCVVSYSTYKSKQQEKPFVSLLKRHTSFFSGKAWFVSKRNTKPKVGMSLRAKVVSGLTAIVAIVLLLVFVPSRLNSKAGKANSNSQERDESYLSDSGSTASDSTASGSTPSDSEEEEEIEITDDSLQTKTDDIFGPSRVQKGNQNSTFKVSIFEVVSSDDDEPISEHKLKRQQQK